MEKLLCMKVISVIFFRQKIIEIIIPKLHNEKIYERWDKYNNLVLDRPDIEYDTVNNTKIFFTYGDGIVGAHSYCKNSKNFLYVKDMENEEYEQDEVDKREKNLKKKKKYTLI